MRPPMDLQPPVSDADPQPRKGAGSKSRMGTSPFAEETVIRGQGKNPKKGEPTLEEQMREMMDEN